jgi:hypothetical protein
MNSSHWQTHPLRRLLLAQFFALTTASVALAQAVNPDAATLAKYDTNKNGRLDPSEITAMQADQAKVPVQTGTAPGDQVVELSPFEVDAGSQKGYYASNTMAGTRLNSKIEDLASSVSVVTKQQMSDFAMLDINDIFAYETSTEGTGNYTDYSVDRNGMVADNIQNNPQGTNRIRGGSAANIAMNNFDQHRRPRNQPRSELQHLRPRAGLRHRQPGVRERQPEPRDHHRGDPGGQYRRLSRFARPEPPALQGQAGRPGQRRLPARRLPPEALRRHRAAL